jgi:predicted transposase YbfD/YdcC
VSDALSSHVLNTATTLAPATERDRRDLAETLAVVPNPRRRRGIRHPFTPLLAIDGKAMRATPRAASPIHLLAILDHATSIVLAQANVDVKTNEIPCLKTVLDQIPDLKDVLVTADALHCQTAHITYLLGRGAHLLVCVYGNQLSAASRKGAATYSQTTAAFTLRTRQEVAAWFGGFGLVSPGVVNADAWRRTGAARSYPPNGRPGCWSRSPTNCSTTTARTC